MSDPTEFFVPQGWTIQSWQSDGIPTVLDNPEYWIGNTLLIGLMGPHLYGMTWFNPDTSTLSFLGNMSFDERLNVLTGHGPVSFPTGYLVCSVTVDLTAGILEGKLVLPQPPDFPDGGGGTFTAGANPPPPLIPSKASTRRKGGTAG